MLSKIMPICVCILLGCSTYAAMCDAWNIAVWSAIMAGNGLAMLKA